MGLELGGRGRVGRVGVGAGLWASLAGWRRVLGLWEFCGNFIFCFCDWKLILHLGFVGWGWGWQRVGRGSGSGAGLAWVVRLET